MRYPEFFNTIPSIELKDPLSELLGTFDRGELAITYLDTVKGAGHSCPTIAGAYLICYHALRSLYPTEPALRGNIAVQFSQDLEEGTTGVVSNVISYITGATEKSGFKGLHGNFVRHGLMQFNRDISSLRFSRTDNGKSVDVFYDPSPIPADPRQSELMPRIMSGQAVQEEKEEFARLWQERVKKILVDNFYNTAVIRVQAV